MVQERFIGSVRYSHGWSVFQLCKFWRQGCAELLRSWDARHAELALKLLCQSAASTRFSQDLHSHILYFCRRPKFWIDEDFFISFIEERSNIIILVLVLILVLILILVYNSAFILIFVIVVLKLVFILVFILTNILNLIFQLSRVFILIFKLVFILLFIILFICCAGSFGRSLHGMIIFTTSALSSMEEDVCLSLNLLDARNHWAIQLLQSHPWEAFIAEQCVLALLHGRSLLSMHYLNTMIWYWWEPLWTRLQFSWLTSDGWCCLMLKMKEGSASPRTMNKRRRIDAACLPRALMQASQPERLYHCQRAHNLLRAPAWANCRTKRGWLGLQHSKLLYTGIQLQYHIEWLVVQLGLCTLTLRCKLL